jgi:hypothetical protein
MDRRSLLRLLGLSAVGLAGCASSDTQRGDPPTRPAPAPSTPEPATPTPTPTPSPTPTPERFVDGLQPSLRETRVTESSDGRLQALVPVENTTDESRDATLAVTIESSDEEYTASTGISVPAGASREYSVTFDVAWSTAMADGDPIVRELLLYNPVYRSPEG